MSRRRGRRGKGGVEGLIPGIALPERGVPRHVRVERDMLRELMAALRTLSDPRLSGATVSRIELTEDLAFARIYVRAGVEGDGDERALMRAFRSAGGRLRGHIGRSLQLRKAPELRFLYDTGYEAAERVDALLEEIRVEDEIRHSDVGAESGEPDLGD
ncbi:MAG: 30S ribosome-binding factor RbfA [Myxococcales bacterium]|nr:30S ribosome-binding factor RbfA [Myxococcales bacterium]